MNAPSHSKQGIRILRFLQSGTSASISEFADGTGENITLAHGRKKRMLAKLFVVQSLCQSDLLKLKERSCSLTQLGRKKLMRLDAKEEGFAAQHRQTVRRDVKIDGATQSVAINLHESPLQRLRLRKDTSGNTWLNDEQVEAGERLRRDFTIGQLMQKVTSSWEAAIGSTKSGHSGKADISDSAVDARARLQKATDALGPDLAGVVTDICCFLKGLESVERERRWPPRSAKLMLRTGLDLLSRHYGTKPGNWPSIQG